MKSILLLKCITFFTCSLLISGCVLDYKKSSVEEPVNLSEQEFNKITYRMNRLAFFASDSSIAAVKDSFHNSNKNIVFEEYFSEDTPNNGIFISIEPLYKTPSMTAVAFGYISFSTLTILPAWSNHDGFTVTYNVFKDGKRLKTFQYDRERFLAVWLPLAAVSWVNFFTDGEYDAFYSINNEFLKDVDMLLKTPTDANKKQAI